ncbi:putative inorganic phosphate cotransporter isoform X2 [Anthonomus grandis grandis]|uniref:putative inorganic phosphate cotransporter isoform X2 n=1 Tax=Anthonomus grandis grandis TaxID=2921223 RepID=UPI002165CA1A|nr:putative inorganic phosphate cotransporter isoform X2 [Anthonomus grandis grandis]
MVKETFELAQIEQKNGFGDKLDDSKREVPTIGIRHLQILVLFLLTFIAYGIRVTLSVAIVAMTDPTASVNPQVPTYPEWHDKSIVLSAFFWGYIIPQVGAGYLSGRFGAKYFLLGAMAACGSLCLFVPLMAAHFGSKGVMINRALQGLSQGFIFPSVHQTLSRWVPPDERSRLGTIVYAAGPFGTVVAMLITGIISASSYGWPMVFYLYGGLSLGWALLCLIFTHNSPGVHPRISEAERYYIEHSLGETEEKSNENRRIPWKSIATSLPMWAILISHCGQNWGFWTLMTEIPNYMAHVMNFHIKSNSVLSALPYFVLWVLSFAMSFFSDYLIVQRILSITNCRKLFNSIGLIIPAIALIFLGITPADQPNRAVALLVIAVGLNAGIFCGFNVNHVDISPRNAGILMGITNCISNITGILAPLFVQFIVTDEQDPNLWKIVFFLTAIIYVVSDIFYVIFGSGEVQKWNDTEDKTNKEP